MNFYQFSCQKPKATLFFKDGQRRIDFVLAYEEEEETDKTCEDKRTKFENGLQEAGLELEHEPKEVFRALMKVK